jgi:hypothetical protein
MLLNTYNTASVKKHLNRIAFKLLVPVVAPIQPVLPETPRRPLWRMIPLRPECHNQAARAGVRPASRC